MGDAKYKRTHLERGLCANCSRPRVYPFTLCAKCREKHRKANNRYQYQKMSEWRKEGKCIRCGRALYPEDEGNLTCAPCIEQINDRLKLREKTYWRNQ